MNSGFLGIAVSLDDEALVIHSEKPLLAISSSVTGGGISPVHCIINRTVKVDYADTNPAEDMRCFALQRGIHAPFQGFMTAVPVAKTRRTTWQMQHLTVTAFVTAGVGNAVAAGISTPAPLGVGTINIILLVDANLTHAALVNAVITVTEAKTASLRDNNIYTADGILATGTSTDAICIACTGRGELLDYAGPATFIGHLLARTVRDGLTPLPSVGNAARLPEKPPHFSAEERDTLYRVIAARRDMRHFTPNTRIDGATIGRLLRATHQAPSVGLMQPWRFIRITKTPQREHIAQLVAAERDATAQALGERGDDFLRLKVEGIRDCAEVWVAVVAPDDGTIFGRRTMPAEMALCSVACAIQNLWLATRAENLGMGWVSMFDPLALVELLGLPAGCQPIAILCIGQVDAFYAAPMLELEGWRHGRMLDDGFFT
jgi:5,6-dimethylbenzimidazole synthase